MPLQIGNRLDVRDQKGAWLEAHVVDIQGDFFKIHYKGWAAKFDEFIPLDSPNDHLLDTKYAEIGLYSRAYGQAKFNNSH